MYAVHATRSIQKQDGVIHQQVPIFYVNAASRDNAMTIAYEILGNDCEIEVEVDAYPI